MDSTAQLRWPRPDGVILLTLGLAWLAVTLWGAHAAIGASASEGADVALGSAAGSLPVVVAASLLAGACVGQVAAAWMPQRVTAALGGGALTGLVAGALILLGYGTTSALATLAITVLVAALLGGASALLPAAPTSAALAATLGVLVTGVVFSWLQGPLTGLLGGGSDATIAAQATAAQRFAYLQSAACGLIAGLVAFGLLRRSGATAAPARAPWLPYLLAGAGPGVLLLVAEGLTQLGGASLLNLVKDLSDGDRWVVEYNGAARLRHALIVGFLGAICAMILFGRSLPSRGESAE